MLVTVTAPPSLFQKRWQACQRLHFSCRHLNKKTGQLGYRLQRSSRPAWFKRGGSRAFGYATTIATSINRPGTCPIGYSSRPTWSGSKEVAGEASFTPAQSPPQSQRAGQQNLRLHYLLRPSLVHTMQQDCVSSGVIARTPQPWTTLQHPALSCLGVSFPWCATTLETLH